MFEVRRLRLLWELAAHGTIAAVAEACALSPSAVSQQLSLLEREVRTPLLIRDGRRLVLTEAARILIAHTERILAEMEQARAEMAALDHNVRGTVGLVAFPSAAGVLAAPAIAECQTTYPDLRVLLGAADTFILPEEAQTLYAAAGDPRELWLLPGVGHARAIEVDSEAYRDRVMEFFAKALAGPTPG